MTNDKVVDFPGELDPAQFRVSGTDIKGHTKRIWTNLQPMHVHMMDVLSNPGGKFPYRNRGDFNRHAIVRHLHFLERIHQPVNSITGALDAMNAVLREAEFRLEFETFINKMVKLINDLVDAGDTLAARTLVLDIVHKVNTMPEGFWKDKYFKTIVEKTKRVLDGIQLEEADQVFAMGDN